MFTAEHRDHVRARVLDLARTDPRVTAGALTGSTAVGAEDDWSDIDVAFGIADGISPDRHVPGRDLGLRHGGRRKEGTCAAQRATLRVRGEQVAGSRPAGGGQAVWMPASGRVRSCRCFTPACLHRAHGAHA